MEYIRVTSGNVLTECRVDDIKCAAEDVKALLNDIEPRVAMLIKQAENSDGITKR